jgi:hypothetical protein
MKRLALPASLPILSVIAGIRAGCVQPAKPGDPLPELTAGQKQLLREGP